MRSFPALASFVILGAAAPVVACESTATPLVCGAGTTQVGTQCVGTATAGAVLDAGGEAAAPLAAVTFDGVAAVAPASATALFVAWHDAKSATAPERMRYRVYLGTPEAAIDYAKPLLTTARGARSVYLRQLDAAKTYSIAVRAVDDADLMDANVVVKTATPAADTKAPNFAGIKSAEAAGSGTVTLTWDAAQDEQTPADAIVYLVYVAAEKTDLDLTAPRMMTKPGATSVDVTGLFDPNGFYRFVVRARDAADNSDLNTIALTSKSGADKTPPTFDGCTAAVADTAGSAIVSWTAATDDTTPADRMAYDVYGTTGIGPIDLTKPLATATAATSVKVDGLTSDAVWRFVCRARDSAGNHDDNTVERLTKTLTDSTLPTFAGLLTSDLDRLARSVTFTWDPGSDDKTKKEQLVYDVFESKTSQGQDFQGPPRASSAPGATSITVADLTPDSTLFWVVRVRDQGGNHDTNTIEAKGDVAPSFARQLQPLFSRNCAVTGCHVPGNPMGGLILAPGFAYRYLVNAKSVEVSAFFRIKPTDPDNSYLYKKISENPPPVGGQMPAPATGSVLTTGEIDLVRRWILEGAVDN